MEPNRFDTLTRSITTTGSRRGAMAALLGGTLGLLGLAESAAKKGNGRGKKKGNGKKNTNGGDQTGQPPSAGSCPAGTKFCEGACRQCCENPDCCGGKACPDSPDPGPICDSGRPIWICACSNGTELCNGKCCRSSEVCSTNGGANVLGCFPK